MFRRNVISTWSSGTGGAGIAGALAYATLITLGFTPKTTLLVMIIVPAIEAVAFYGLLRTPQTIPRNDSTVSTITTGTTDTAVEVGYKDDEKPLTGLGSKLRYVPSLMKYIIPLSLVYLFEYFINQGLVS